MVQVKQGGTFGTLLAPKTTEIGVKMRLLEWFLSVFLAKNG
jgi:hypothetical protein